MDSSDNRIIKLNVGGVHYTTFKTTLTSDKDSLFNALLRNPTWIDDCLFVDRNGDIFRYILDFLRGKEFYLPNSYLERKSLIEEANYFGLIELAEKISQYDEHKCIETYYDIANGQLFASGFGDLCREVFETKIDPTYRSHCNFRLNCSSIEAYDVLYSKGFHLITKGTEHLHDYNGFFARD